MKEHTHSVAVKMSFTNLSIFRAVSNDYILEIFFLFSSFIGGIQ